MDKLICINKDLCMSKNYFFLLLIFFIMMTLYYIYNIKQNTENNLLKKIKNELLEEIKKNNNLQTHLPVIKLLEYKDNTTIKLNNTLIENDLFKKENDLLEKEHDLLEKRDRDLLDNPLIAPERRVEITRYPNRPLINKINIPTRGYPDNYQLIGLLSRKNDEKLLQLFGRPTFPGSNQYEYFVTTNNHGFSNKIPIESKGRKEIEDGSLINIPFFDESKGDFEVKLYNYNTPRYNPYI